MTVVLGLIPDDFPYTEASHDYGLITGDIPVPREGEIVVDEDAAMWEVTQVVYDYAIPTSNEEARQSDAPHVWLHAIPAGTPIGQKEGSA